MAPCPNQIKSPAATITSSLRPSTAGRNRQQKKLKGCGKSIAIQTSSPNLVEHHKHQHLHLYVCRPYYLPCLHIITSPTTNLVTLAAHFGITYKHPHSTSAHRLTPFPSTLLQSDRTRAPPSALPTQGVRTDHHYTTLSPGYCNTAATHHIEVQQ